MTAKIKPFVAHTFLAPAHWGRAVGSGFHNQIEGLAFATTKAALTEHLTSLGQSAALSAEVAHRFKRIGGQTFGGNYVDAILAARPTQTEPMVLIWDRGSHDEPVLRVDPDGAFTTVGHFRRGSGYMPVFEPR